MTMISEAKAIFAEWITAVTRAVDIAAERVVRTRRILLRELDDGSFVATPAAAFGRLEGCVPGQPCRGRSAAGTYHDASLGFPDPGDGFPRWHDPVADRSSDAVGPQ